MVSPTFMEDNNTYSIRTFENKEISLPDKEDFYPSKINFEWHREKIFKRNR
jgi:putative restriction endonuclease